MVRCQTGAVDASGGLEHGVVGRADELAVVGDLLDASASGEAQTLLVAGDAGVGKTALVTRACADRAASMTVLSGTCLPLTSMSIPFLPIRSALRAVVGSAGDVPDVTAEKGDFVLGFDAWLEQRCAERPAVLVIDDLQWADRSTLDAVMYVIAGPSSRRLAVVATLRSGEVGVGHPLQRWLADVRRLPRTTELALGPLDRAGTAAQLELLLGGSPHQSLVDDVHRHARGNPYFTRLMVAGLSAEARSAPEAVPVDLRSAVLRSWSTLSPATRRLATVLAVGGRPMHADELAEVVGEEPGRIRSRLQMAVDAGTVVSLADGAFWFHHPLSAEVLEAELAQDDRRDLHARFADVIERGELERRSIGRVEIDASEIAAIAVDVADHRYAAKQAAEAYRATLIAADAVSRVEGAGEQVRLLRRAVELSTSDSASETALEAVLRRLRTTAAEAGFFEEEHDAVEQLLAITDPVAAPLAMAELIVRRSSLRFSLGRDFNQLDELRRAERLAAIEPASAEYATVLAELSRAEFWSGVKSAAEHAEFAVAAAERSGDPRALAYACAQRSMIAEEAGDDVAALRFAECAVASADAARDWFAGVRAALRLALSIAAWPTQEYASIIRSQRLTMASRGAPAPYLAWLSAVEAASWLIAGRLPECEEQLRLALGSNPGPIGDAQARLVAARLATLQGRQSEAESHLARAEELFVDGSTFLAMEFAAVRSEVRLGGSDPRAGFAAAAVALIGSTAPPPIMCEWLVPFAARGLADQVQSARDAGRDVVEEIRGVERFASAHPHVQPDIQPRASKWGGQNRALEALYHAELARARAGDGEADAWMQAADACSTGVLPFEEAYARWRAAEALLGRSHRRKEGVEMVRSALALSRRLGARPIEEELLDLARRARVRIDEPAAGASDVPAALHGLTEREREVLDLIAVGRTYAEIARSLMISEKTVSTHVSHLLAKTGSANRVELARLVHRVAPDRESGT